MREGILLAPEDAGGDVATALEAMVVITIVVSLSSNVVVMTGPCEVTSCSRMTLGRTRVLPAVGWTRVMPTAIEETSVPFRQLLDPSEAAVAIAFPMAPADGKLADVSLAFEQALL